MTCFGVLPKPKQLLPTSNILSEPHQSLPEPPADEDEGADVYALAQWCSIRLDDSVGSVISALAFCKRPPSSHVLPLSAFASCVMFGGLGP